MPTKVRLVKAMAFPVVMYGCENCIVKKAECWRIDAFELWCWRRLLKSPLDCKEIQPAHPKADQSWVFIGRTDAKAETPVLGHLMRRVDSLEKSLMLGGIGGRRRRGRRDEMAGWHHWLDGHEFECTPGVDEGQGGLACCNSWGRKESDTTERLIWSDLIDELTSLLLQNDLLHPC